MSTKAFIQLHLKPSSRAVLLVAILAVTVFANTVRSETIDNNHHGHDKDAFGFIQNLKGCHKGQNTPGLHNLKHYLEKFGYLDRVGDDDNDEFDDALESAIKSYQETYGLEVTGVLDDPTAKQMARPRCGFPDKVNNNNKNNSKDLDHHHHHHHHNNRKLIHKVSHFNLYPGAPRWSKSVLTYHFTTRVDSVVRSACASAFQRWAQVTRLTFREVTSGSQADIKVGFYRGNHGDGPQNAFDGRGGTLAHASRPTGGIFHFDAEESWSMNPGPSTVDLESVAVHEIGHVLGLDHEPGIPQAIMYPYFGYGMIKRNLHADDIRGIRTLYGLTN